MGSRKPFQHVGDGMPAKKTLSTKKWLLDCSIKNFQGWSGNMSELELYRMFVIANVATPRKG